MDLFAPLVWDKGLEEMTLRHFRQEMGYGIRVGELFHHSNHEDRVILSLQGSATHYCRPRILLEDINRYEALEVGLRYGNVLVRPGVVALPAFNEYFEDTDRAPVAGCMPLDAVKRLRQALLDAGWVSHGWPIDQRREVLDLSHQRTINSKQQVINASTTIVRRKRLVFSLELKSKSR